MSRPDPGSPGPKKPDKRFLPFIAESHIFGAYAKYSPYITFWGVYDLLIAYRCTETGSWFTRYLNLILIGVKEPSEPELGAKAHEVRRSAEYPYIS